MAIIVVRVGFWVGSFKMMRGSWGWKSPGRGNRSFLVRKTE